MKRILALIVALLLICSLFTACNEEEKEVEAEPVFKEEIIEESQFYKNMQSNDRTIAVMIDNDSDYTGPQAGLENAFMIYEAYVEGGNTRMMALYKRSFFTEENIADRIGPVRSSRHYFLDFALENDAIYAHCGFSPRAQQEIASRGVNNINGLYENAPFFRFTQYNNTWHNLYTDFKRLDVAADSHGYERKTDVTYNFLKNYEVPEGVEEALTINIPYLITGVSYEYDEEKGTYIRYKRGKTHTMQNGVTLEATNIIILEMQNFDLDGGDDKGRQDLMNTGEGKGKFITAGKVFDITWKKPTRDAMCRYYIGSKEITLNPGLTFVQIVPPAMAVTIEGAPEVIAE